MKKYEFTGETKQIDTFGNITVRRIRATMDFGTVKYGDLGGWIEKEENLNQEDNAWVFGNAKVWGDAEISGNAKIWGDAKICDNAGIWGDAEIYRTTHVLVLGPIGSRNDFTTFFRDKDNEIKVKCGCFLGKIDEFLEKVQQTHGNSKHALAYRAAVEVAKLQIDLESDQNDNGGQDDGTV